MNGKKSIIKKILVIIVLTIYITLSFAIIEKKPTFADSGFGTSYSGGSSSSGGSSHSSSSSSHSRRSSSSHSSSSSSHSSSSSSHSSSGGENYSNSDNTYSSKDERPFFVKAIAFVVGVVAILMQFIWPIFIIICISRVNKKIRKESTNNKTKDELDIENEIKQYIPDFDKQKFLNEGYKMYCDIQEAWMNFKLEDVKDIITDELYNMYESQLATLEVKGEQNVMKDFALQRSFLKDVSMENNTLTITTGYIIEFYDYIAEQATGKVLRGTANKKVRVTYEMKFRQSLDQSKKVTKCPNCGADIEMNTSGVCEYCHTKLITENTKWVLTEKKTLNQE